MMRRVNLFRDKRVDTQFETEKWVTWASILNEVANRLGGKIPVEDWSDEEIEAFVDGFNAKPLAFRIRNGVWDPDTIEGHIQEAHKRLSDNEIEEIHRTCYETGRCPVDGWRRKEAAF
ncbi:MAG: hypothetical protein QXI11_01980 [Thermoproteota archaeon]